MPIEVPCGQCIGCRLERSRQWAIRCMHEASLHEENCFITLTYNPENLPEDGSLHVEAFQKFMKRLRKEYAPKKIRFFHCGEYGDKMGRPHYHACLFGIDFPDKKSHNTRQGIVQSSDTLARLWPFGFNVVGDVTFESAAYVARYITKKVTGEKALEHYTDIDYTTGEVLAERKPEYVTMSRRPGIAHGWFEKYKGDVFPSDNIIVRGKEMKPPKYYDRQYEIIDEEAMKKIKGQRVAKAVQFKENNTERRLRIREEVAENKLKDRGERKYEK